MIHTIGEGALTAGQTINGVISGQTINGIIISKNGAFSAGDTLQITLKSDYHPQKVLVNSISLESLAHMSDIEFGQSAMLQDFADGQAAGVEVDALAVQTVRSLVVPLGCIKLRANKSELEILVRSAGTGTFDVSSYYDEDGTDHVISLIESHVLRDTYYDVSDVFLVSDVPLVALASKAVTVLINTAKGNTVCSLAGVLGYNLAKGAIEAEGPGRVVKCFSASDDLYDDCEVQISGADAADCTVITRQVSRDTQRVSRGTIEAVDGILSRMSRMDSEKLRAMRRAGIIGRRVDLEIGRHRMTTGSKPSKPNLVDVQKLAAAIHGN